VLLFTFAGKAERRFIDAEAVRYFIVSILPMCPRGAAEGLTAITVSFAIQ
jgi:hypothetical protein